MRPFASFCLPVLFAISSVDAAMLRVGSLVGFDQQKNLMLSDNKPLNDNKPPNGLIRS